MKAQPLHNYVLVKRKEVKEIKRNGLIIPTENNERFQEAQVISVGPGMYDGIGNIIPMPVKPDDVVLIDRFSGQIVTIDDIEYALVKADQIVMVMK